MKRVKGSVVNSVIDVAIRTGHMTSVVVAADEDEKPTHFIVVLPIDQVDKISVPGTVPATIWCDDFE